MNKSSTQFTQNSIYGYVQNYEYLIPALSATTIGVITGAKIGGVHKATIGGTIGMTVGITEQILLYYKVISTYYLTSAILGANIMTEFQLPCYIGEAVGAAVGLAAPTGYLNNLKDAIPTVMTAAIITQYTREKFANMPQHALYGAAAGTLISLADEALIHFNISNQHYLSTTIIVATSFDFMSPKFNNFICWLASFSQPTKNLYNLAISFTNNIAQFPLAVGTIIGGYVANKTELNILDWKPISLANDLFETYKKLLDKKELECKILIFAIATTTTQISLYNAILKESESFQTISPLYANLGDTTRSIENWNLLKLELLKYLFFIAPSMITATFINSFLNSYFSRQISYLIDDSINSKWLTNDTALKLSKSKSTLSLIHYKTDDVLKISRDGSSLIGNAFFKVIGGIMSIAFITNNKAMDILGYSVLYNTFTAKISEIIAEPIDEYSHQIRDLVAIRDSIEKDIINKVETITESKGTFYHLKKINNITTEARNLSQEKETLQLMHSTWVRFKDSLSFVFNYLIIAYKLFMNEIDFNVRYKTLDTVNNVFTLISFETDNKANIVEIEKALTSINLLISEMENNSLAITTHDRKYIQGDISITFENFTVYLQEEEEKLLLLHLDSLQLTKGIYALSGAKGSGKSSFTSKIIDLNYNNVLAEGAMIFSTPHGKQPVILYVSQTNHMPLNSTLLELFYYPQLLPIDPFQLDHLSVMVKDFWQKITIGNASTTTPSLMEKLHDVKDWETVLSGGEQKILRLISVMMQEPKPDILILDESFTGLDAHTNQRAQDVIKEYMNGDNIIISIDHHAAKNNFYDICLNLTNHSFEIIDMH